MQTRQQLVRKRAIGLVVGILGLLATYFGFNTANEAHQEIMKLDAGKLNQVRLK